MFYEAAAVLKKRFPRLECTDEHIAQVLEKAGVVENEAVSFCQTLDDNFMKEFSRRSAVGGKNYRDALIAEEFVKFQTRRRDENKTGWFEKLSLKMFGFVRFFGGILQRLS